MDIAKRLLDYGFHAPTVYFPLVVKEALMIEPTETESKATLDAFVEVLRLIMQEPAELVHEAPHTTPISRPDEVKLLESRFSSGRPLNAPPPVRITTRGGKLRFRGCVGWVG